MYLDYFIYIYIYIYIYILYSKIVTLSYSLSWYLSIVEFWLINWLSMRLIMHFPCIPTHSKKNDKDFYGRPLCALKMYIEMAKAQEKINLINKFWNTQFDYIFRCEICFVSLTWTTYFEVASINLIANIIFIHLFIKFIYIYICMW